MGAKKREREKRENLAAKGKSAGAFLVVAVAALLPFAPGLRSPFIFDDFNTIVQNPALQRVNLDVFVLDPTTFSVKPGNWPYRPLTVLLNSILYQLAGPRDPLPWHLFQAGLHCLNALLVLLMSQHVFALKRSGALAAGLLFALAPLQSQAVIYISARSMVAAACPALFCVLALARSVSAQDPLYRRWWQMAGVAAALMAFFTSEGALALVWWLLLALLVLGVKPGDRRVRLFLAVVVGGAVFYLAARLLTSAGPAFSAHPRIKPPYTPLESLSLQLSYPFVMARLFLFPLYLNLFHHPEPGRNLLDPRLLLPAVLVALSFVVALLLFRKHKAAGAGLAWFLGSLLPSLIVPLNIPWAEHRSYLALPGLVVLAGWVTERGLTAYPPGCRRRFWSMRVSLALAMMFLAVLSWRRSETWLSAERLFLDTARKSPTYDVPWNFLAEEARQRGGLQNYRRALRWVERAVSLNPDFADAHSLRAAILMQLQRFAEAVEAAGRAVELDPGNATYWNNLGTALWALGRREEAERALTEAINRMAPHDPNRGIYERNLFRLREERQRLEGRAHPSP